MELFSTIAITAHALFAGIGIGAATVSDVLFLRALKNKKITSQDYKTLKIVSKLIISVLFFIILSGAVIILLYSKQGSAQAILGNDKFLAKFTIVGVLILNGIFFHTVFFPALKKFIDQDLTLSFAKGWALKAASLSGAISVVSWYSAFILGSVRNLNYSYNFFIFLYLALIFGGAFTSYLVLTRLILGNIQISPKKIFGIKLIVLLGITLFAGYLYKGIKTNPANQSNVYEVCINELPPWFSPEILKIKLGDTVTWRQCAEKNGHINTIHTHPILSIDGPEKFNTNLRPVGDEQGEHFTFTFSKKGVYTYICPTHPYMRGLIAVDAELGTAKIWPPEEIIKPSLLAPPKIFGKGEIWINTQFAKVPNQLFPGTITVVDAETWKIKTIISHPEFNNPHNPWHSYDRKFIFQTQWHSNRLHKIDAESKTVLKSVILGNSPAHVFTHPKKPKIYVTLNNENRVMVLDFDLNILKEIKTDFGPHGMWIDPSGKWLSIAATLSEKLNIIDLEKEEVVASFKAPGLPLATSITNDGRFALISLLLENKVRVIDLKKMEIIADIEVGLMPIWPAPAPDNRHIFVPNTKSADISVIDLNEMKVIKTIPAAQGAHGISFGPKKGGGWYGYFSNKFARVMGIVDIEKMELAGYVNLPENAWGGNGILALPNSYDTFLSE